MGIYRGTYTVDGSDDTGFVFGTLVAAANFQLTVAFEDFRGTPDIAFQGDVSTTSTQSAFELREIVTRDPGDGEVNGVIDYADCRVEGTWSFEGESGTVALQGEWL